MPIVVTQDLAITCLDAGPEDGPVVLLLHGWPDDATTWDAVTPALNAGGLRTVAPFLRGSGPTRFTSDTAPRTGNGGILAMDAIALMDGLGIDRFSVVGHDRGSNIAEAPAVGWPERVERIALLSSPPRLGGMPTPTFAQAQRRWYHCFQATRRGAEAIRRDLACIMWEDWSCGRTGHMGEPGAGRLVRRGGVPARRDVVRQPGLGRHDAAFLPRPLGRGRTRPARRLAGGQAQGDAAAFAAHAVCPGRDRRREPAGSQRGRRLEILRAVRAGAAAWVGHFPSREAPAAVAARLAGFLRPG